MDVHGTISTTSTLPQSCVSDPRSSGALWLSGTYGDGWASDWYPSWGPRRGWDLCHWVCLCTEAGFPCAQGAPLVQGEHHVCVTAAAVWVAHTFQCVIQTKWAAVSCLRYQWSFFDVWLLHWLSQSEPWSNLKVGKGVRVLYRHLWCGGMLFASSMCRCSVLWSCCPVWRWRGGHIEAKSAGHCYCVGAEVSCCQGSNERGQVWPTHR